MVVGDDDKEVWKWLLFGDKGEPPLTKLVLGDRSSKTPATFRAVTAIL